MTSSPVLIDGLSDVADRYDVLFCDVWGVIHNGVRALDDACGALVRARQQGKMVVLVSNSPRPGPGVAAQVASLGVPDAAYDDIVTSGDVTRLEIEKRRGQAFFHIGPERDLPIFDGLDVRFSSLEEADFCVCTGLFFEERETEQDYADTLGAMRQKRMAMICANPDLVVERGKDLLPCAGLIAQAYEALGGEAIYAGKPHRPIYEEALRRVQTRLGSRFEAGRLLAIGDAIRTDIAGAARMSFDSLFIARGIHAQDVAEGLGTEAARTWLSQQTHQPTAMMQALSW